MLKKRGKTAQITLFIILGIVMVIIIAFLLFIKAVITESQIKTEGDKANQDSSRTEPINFFISSCLDRVSEEAVYLLGKQGGRLYLDQGGMASEQTTLKLDYPVSYGIYYNLSKQPLTQPPPFYPRLRFESTVSPYAYFGENLFLPLCYKNGINYRLQYDPKYPDKNIIACSDYADEGYLSVQKEMESYVEQNIDNCIYESNVSFLESGNKINLGEPEAEVLFTDVDIKIYLKYPTVIEYKNQDDSASFLDFKSTINTRFKLIYTIANKIVERDSKNLLWKKNNLSDLTSILRIYLDPNINISIDCPLCDDTKKADLDTINYFDDIVTIEDSSTLVKGEPFLFRFASKNRRPSLDWIVESPRKNFDYEIVTWPGEKLEFRPLAFDPDEDNVTYLYSGWKQDYDEFFLLYDCCKGYGSGNRDCKSDYSYCVKKSNETPNYWTTTDLYQATQKDSNYSISTRDLGEHNIRITAVDEHGLRDYQDIRILVFDLPRAVAGHTNRFDDIDNQFASIEDPYILNATGSSSIFGEIEFKWEDINEPFVKLSRDPEVFLPKYANIDNQMKFLEFITLGIHEITLYVKNNISTDTETFNLDVRECLPHVLQDTAPYPYNELTFDDGFQRYSVNEPDPFMPTHVCCENNSSAIGSFSYSEYDKICYNYTEYGGFFSFDEDLFINIPLYGRPYPDEPVPFFVNISNQANDIYKREYIRDCGFSTEINEDKRGNRCDGDITEQYSLYQECADITTNFSINTEGLIIRRCSGPPHISHDYFKIGNATITQPNCTDYEPGDTFEELYDEVADPYRANTQSTCAEERRCSIFTSGLGLYDDTGTYNVSPSTSTGFACRSFCDGEGGCTIPGDCVCSFSLGCGAEFYCDGRLPGERTGGCGIGGAGYPWFEDLCGFTCQLSGQRVGVCRTTGGVSGAECSANPDASVGSTRYEPWWTSNECDGKRVGHDEYVPSLGKTVYCEVDCTPVYCDDGYALDDSSKTCRTDCQDNSHCDAGYNCISNACV